MPDPNNVVLPDHRLIAMLPAKVGNISIKTALWTSLGRAVDDLDYARSFETVDKATCARLRDDGWLTFCVTRDPVDRLVSCWRNKIAGSELFRSFARDPRMRHRMPFDEFARICCETPDPRADFHCRSQAYDLVMGNRIVPEIRLRFEKLGRDWRQLQRTVLLRLDLELASLPRLNRSEADRPVVGLETRKLISLRYHQDYKYFFGRR